MAEFTNAAVLGKYFITNSASSVFKIPVGITNVSSQSRTVNFSVSSPTGAAAGTQYTLAGSSIVIPANTAVDSISLKGLFAGYPGSRRDTLVFKITGGDVGVFTGAETYKVVMQKYCDVTLAGLGGNFTKTYENGSYGPYVSTVTNVTSTGATTATAKLNNIYDSGISGNITFNWTDPAAFFVTIPSGQNTGFTSGGLPLLLRGTPGKTSTFSSCDNTLTLYLDLYTTAGLYDTWTMTMAR